ncbi:integrase catalytic domain-containing protein [Trichonephila clavipes]|nr:integrase catalytic domain-containing protein [Trichonephila clavipes]
MFKGAKKEDLRRIASELELCNTVFGYIASGGIPVSSENKPHCGLIKDHVNFEKTMRRFWEIENVEPETKNNETIIYQLKLQRILWRKNMDEPIKMFELSTVTYGTSAPFLATCMLKQLTLDKAENFPLGSSVVMSDMYIDDVLTGAETLLEAKELKNQLINIFAKGDSSEIKVLGVYWNPKDDCFSFRIIDDINIDRCIVVEQLKGIKLHGFSDTSQSAYGAVVYSKSVTSDGRVLVHLIASKS